METCSDVTISVVRPLDQLIHYVWYPLMSGAMSGRTSMLSVLAGVLRNSFERSRGAWLGDGEISMSRIVTCYRTVFISSLHVHLDTS